MFAAYADDEDEHQAFVERLQAMTGDPLEQVSHRSLRALYSLPFNNLLYEDRFVVLLSSSENMTSVMYQYHLKTQNDAAVTSSHSQCVEDVVRPVGG